MRRDAQLKQWTTDCNRTREPLRAWNAATVTQIFAPAFDGSPDVRSHENIGYDANSYARRFRMAVRSIALVGFVTLTAVATALGVLRSSVAKGRQRAHSSTCPTLAGCLIRAPRFAS